MSRASAHTRNKSPGLWLLEHGHHTTLHSVNKQRWRTLPGAADGYDYADIGFVELDLGDASSLSTALAGCDLVVHTAGPFQRKNRPEVLEAAIEAKVCEGLCG